MPPTERHVPVLLDRVADLFRPAVAGRSAVLVDATLGLGGHSLAMLAEHPRLRIIGLDRDPHALDIAGQRLAAYADRVHLEQVRYDDLPTVLARLGVPRVDGVLLDLGVSSLQIDEPGRGFSYARDAPLDMRMDPTAPRTAADVLNDYDVEALTRVLRDFGEERLARRIARAVVRERSHRPFDTSARLVDVIRAAVPAPARRTGGHPAKRVFQALRIEVNDELRALERVLPAALAVLRVGGRVVVLAYHSLEDRIVKRVLAAGSANRTPPGLPIELPGSGPELRLLTRGAELPSPTETAANPRAASVRLRAAERIRELASS